MKRRLRQRAQAMVETAIVLPLNIFLILGIIQYALIGQARAMAKYAAYRAVRVGSMQHADPDKMRLAALMGVLPVISTTYSGAPVDGAETFEKIQSPVDVVTKWYKVRAEEMLFRVKTAGLQYVKVVICGPLKADLDNNAISDLNDSQGDDKEVDFDDPRVASEDTQAAHSINGFKKFMRTKLRIQVQFSYRMPIPFANWIIASAYLGNELTDVLRMQTRPELPHFGRFHFLQLQAAYRSKIYVAPINVGYAMRMQSNFDKSKLPTDNQCAHYSAK